MRKYILIGISVTLVCFIGLCLGIYYPFKSQLAGIIKDLKEIGPFSIMIMVGVSAIPLAPCAVIGVLVASFLHHKKRERQQQEADPDP